ncbi:MAG: ROK family protein [Ignavibacteriaceae bacterium]|jgi:glucokinase
MKYNSDKRIVMTLDAGGTNFVFSAIQGCEQIVKEIRLDSNADNLDKCLSNLIEGFTKVRNILPQKPAAISFAFPGPADYPNGIIGDLPNLPAFRGGVALGPMLNRKFGLPVFINNDGDLYAYGEAIAGFLPFINSLLEKAGNPKRYNNLIGLTLGTGFGCGIVSKGELYLGDNSIAGEIWLLRNKLIPTVNIEESVSIRCIQRVYAEKAGLKKETVPSPKEIFEIGSGKAVGNKEAALDAYKHLAEAAGDAISNAITLLDGLVVIGGGLAGAHPLFMKYLIDEMNGYFVKSDGTKFKRLVADVYNLEDDAGLQKFVKSNSKEISVYGTDEKVTYDPSQKIGVGISEIGTSKAISIGAYAFALNKMDQNK